MGSNPTVSVRIFDMHLRNSLRLAFLRCFLFVILSSGLEFGLDLLEIYVFCEQLGRFIPAILGNVRIDIHRRLDIRMT